MSAREYAQKRKIKMLRKQLIKDAQMQLSMIADIVKRFQELESDSESDSEPQVKSCLKVNLKKWNKWDQAGVSTLLNKP